MALNRTHLSRQEARGSPATPGTPALGGRLVDSLHHLLRGTLSLGRGRRVGGSRGRRARRRRRHRHLLLGRGSGRVAGVRRRQQGAGVGRGRLVCGQARGRAAASGERRRWPVVRRCRCRALDMHRHDRWWIRAKGPRQKPFCEQAVGHPPGCAALGPQRCLNRALDVIRRRVRALQAVGALPGARTRAA